MLKRDETLTFQTENYEKDLQPIQFRRDQGPIGRVRVRVEGPAEGFQHQDQPPIHLDG